MVSYRDLAAGFKSLNIPKDVPVIVHTSHTSLDDIRGGCETILGALLANFQSIMMPTFTLNTMLIPEDGPNNNGVTYGSAADKNSSADFFLRTLESDHNLGPLSETLRNHTAAQRSSHPILSFSGIGVEEALESQTLEEPLSPIMVLTELDGWVILIDADQTVNTSIHVAEQHSGRKTFTRWALTTHGVYECPNFPGCPRGFNKITPMLNGMISHAEVGKIALQAIPLQTLMMTASKAVREDPFALLCENPECAECNAIRTEVKQKQQGS